MLATFNNLRLLTEAFYEFFANTVQAQIARLFRKRYRGFINRSTLFALNYSLKFPLCWTVTKSVFSTSISVFSRL